MRICVLGSGSSGNSIYVSSGGFGFLVDAGLSCRDIGRRLASIGVALEGISAILISHEHTDHVRGLQSVCRSFGIPVYLNRATASAIIERGIQSCPMRIFKTGAEFALGPLRVMPFPVMHDALDPVGFTLSCGDCRVGIATDLGHPSESVKTMLRGCRALILEANHDPLLLENVSRPLSLKRRISSDSGHLSNEVAGTLIGEVASEMLRDVFLAHLSLECNRPDLALSEARRAIEESGYKNVAVRLTFADRVSDVVEYFMPEAEVVRLLKNN